MQGARKVGCRAGENPKDRGEEQVARALAAGLCSGRQERTLVPLLFLNGIAPNTLSGWLPPTPGAKGPSSMRGLQGFVF